MIQFTASTECGACNATFEASPVEAAGEAANTLLREATSAGWVFYTDAHGQQALCPDHADLQPARTPDRLAPVDRDTEWEQGWKDESDRLERIQESTQDCDCSEHPDYRSGEDWHQDGCDR